MNDADQQLADYFKPDGFPAFTIDSGRAWTSAQVHQVLVHHREFLRQMIEPSVRAVIADRTRQAEAVLGVANERNEAWRTIDALEARLEKAAKRIAELEAERDEAREIGRRAYQSWMGPRLRARHAADFGAVMPAWLTAAPDAARMPRADATLPADLCPRCHKENRDGGWELCADCAAPDAATGDAGTTKTPQAWCDQYRLDVRDDDGWRGDDALPWETPITLPDFWRRYGHSTAKIPARDDYLRIVADVRAAKDAEASSNPPPTSTGATK